MVNGKWLRGVVGSLFDVGVLPGKPGGYILQAFVKKEAFTLETVGAVGLDHLG